MDAIAADPQRDQILVQIYATVCACVDDIVMGADPSAVARYRGMVEDHGARYRVDEPRRACRTIV